MSMIDALAMFGLGHWEILIIILVLVLLFGSAKIPALMKSMGSGVSQFKKGIKEGEREAAEEAQREKEEAAKKEAEEKKTGDAPSGDASKS